MSILIKGMDMPETCKECVFSRYILGEWFCRTTTTLDDDGTELWESVGENGNSKRADFCPLVQVPSHGRLGDLDVLAKRVEYEQFHRAHTDSLAARHHVAEYGHFLKEIADAPTIIQADDEEDGMDSFIRILKD